MKNLNIMSGYQGLKYGLCYDRWSDEEEILTDNALTIEGHPVMERWETPYMKMFAAVVTPHGGQILECGFGMGISAQAIQSYCPTEHVIIEFNDDVFKRLMMFKQKAQ
jgi:guanidinoacetate N-methyltransferase